MITIKFKCLTSFSGPRVNGTLGKIIEITDKEIIKDLQKANYIEKIKSPKKVKKGDEE